MGKRFLTLVICLLAVCLLATTAVAAGEGETLTISNVQGFLTFAENCRLDS